MALSINIKKLRRVKKTYPTKINWRYRIQPIQYYRSNQVHYLWINTQTNSMHTSHLTLPLVQRKHPSDTHTNQSHSHARFTPHTQTVSNISLHFTSEHRTISHFGKLTTFFLHYINFMCSFVLASTSKINHGYLRVNKHLFDIWSSDKIILVTVYLWAGPGSLGM